MCISAVYGYVYRIYILWKFAIISPSGLYILRWEFQYRKLLILQYRVKKQYLHILQVGRYCILASQISIPLYILPNKHKAFVQHLYNVGPTSPPLVQHCINAMQLFCVHWALIHPFQWQHVTQWLKLNCFVQTNVTHFSITTRHTVTKAELFCSD